jgi:alpha-tubulin suppressor-like RCC1 family protein
MNGSLFSCGMNTYNQIGRSGNSTITMIIPGLFDIVDMSGAIFHASAIDKNGKLYRWGKNDVRLSP